jgi:hypothetical protein
VRNGTLRRAAAAGALALYALVALVLVPLHALEDSPAVPSGGDAPGLRWEAACPGEDCGDPTHRHEGHAHDPASCASCAQARAAAAPAPAGPAADAVLAAAAAVPAPPSAAPAAALPGLPAARGPPAAPRS